MITVIFSKCNQLKDDALQDDFFQVMLSVVDYQISDKHNKKIKKGVNPPRLIRFREYRRGFQTPHGLLPMPATLSRNGFLTTDTAQTQ